MSSSIWTRCAGTSEQKPLAGEAWRVVEAQHQISTLKLVDSTAEQQLLEELLEQSKPPRPSEPSAKRLDFLLYTPFRYPPLRYGSRFGRKHERGIWYGAEELPTAFAEKAFYELLFRAGTEAELSRLIVERTAFQAGFKAKKGIDLTDAPFSRYRKRICSPTRYADSQELGSEMRGAGVEAFRFNSARCPKGGVNVGLFSPDAISGTRPKKVQTWLCDVTAERVEFSPKNTSLGESQRFTRTQFEVDGALPSPAV